MKKLFAITISALIALTLLLSPAAEGGEVSYGKEYSLITPASSGYPDDGIKLTDGIFGTVPDGKNNYYSSSAYVGLNRSNVNENGDFVIILDLGRKYSDLSAFTIGFLNETDVGIYAPKSVTFALSDERNGEYTNVGTLDTQKSTAGGLSETFAMTLAADDAEGRFVRVTIEHLGIFSNEDGEQATAGWTFIDEISVYSSGNSNANGNTTGESTDESVETAPSQSETDITSDVPDISAESSVGEQVNPGDNGFSVAIWTLLAISMLAMAAALFVKKKESF
jgi:hypothetical protein